MLKLKRIRVTFNHILTTKDVYDNDVTENGMIVKTKGTVKEYQKVLCVGSTVNVCKPGDVVMIDPKRYATMKHKDGENWNGVVKDNPVVAYNIPIIEVNGKDCMFLYDSDIQFILEDYEEAPDMPSLYVAPSPTILQ